VTDPGVIYLRRLADRVADLPHATLVDAVEDVKAVANAAGGSFTRARPGHAYPLRAHDRIVDRGTESFARIQGVPVGFWSILTYGSTEHRIPLGASAGRSRARRNAKGRRLLGFQGGTGAAYGPVVHHGATGRGTWDRVVANATPLVLDRFADNVDRVVIS